MDSAVALYGDYNSQYSIAEYKDLVFYNNTQYTETGCVQYYHNYVCCVSYYV